MALNLVRNSKVFFTTNVDANGTLPRGGYGPANTYEIQVLDGFSFSQNTNTETITINESGASPVRGQRSFNTSLAPVDFSFSTYIKLKNDGSKIVADESVLWNALFTSEGIRETQRVPVGTGGTGTISSVTYTSASSTVGITGTGFTAAAAFAAGDIVSISGLTAANAASTVLVNGYGAVVSATGTNINIALTPAPGASLTGPITGGAITLTKHGITQSVRLGSVSGGVGSISGVTYTASSGNLTIAGSTLPLTVTSGSIVAISGITASTQVTGASVETICQAAYVSSANASQIVLQLANPPSSAVTFGSVTGLILNEAAWTENSTNFSYISTAASDRQKLQTFGMLIVVDNVVYAIDNCALNQASIDFAIDGITTVAWTGQGTSLRRLGATTDNIGVSGGNFTGTAISGRYTTSTPDCSYLTNRLSTIAMRSVNQYLRSDNTTAVTAGETYALALTGGNININNNITYLTPAILGTVNTPSTYFQGTRAISGSINAYLKTGSSDDAGVLLSDMLDAARVNPEIMFNLTLSLGGASAPRVVLEMPSAVTTIPSVEVQQLVSTTINFTAEGSKPNNTPATFDLQEHNDLTVRYYA